MSINEVISRELAYRINKYLTQRNLRAEELAGLCNLPEQTIKAALELEEISIGAMMKICRAIHISIEQILRPPREEPLYAEFVKKIFAIGTSRIPLEEKKKAAIAACQKMDLGMQQERYITWLTHEIGNIKNDRNILRRTWRFQNLTKEISEIPDEYEEYKEEKGDP